MFFNFNFYTLSYLYLLYCTILLFNLCIIIIMLYILIIVYNNVIAMFIYYKPNIIVIFVENSSFRSYGVIFLPQMPLTYYK